MTWATFIKSVAWFAPSIPEKHVAKILRLAADEIRAETKVGGTIRWPDLGEFSLRTRKARKILHPVTRAPMRLKATKSVGFRPAGVSKW